MPTAIDTYRSYITEYAELICGLEAELHFPAEPSEEERAAIKATIAYLERQTATLEHLIEWSED